MSALFLLHLMLATVGLGQFAVTEIRSFGQIDRLGLQSSAPLLQGSDGAFYGTTYDGGGTVRGTVFKLSADGSLLSVLHFFAGEGDDGALLYDGVIEGTDGALYGTTGEGGRSNRGTIFRLNRDGSDFRLLHTFTGVDGDGGEPFAGLLAGSGDTLYGTTRRGGISNLGTIFRLRSGGSDYTTLHQFTGANGDGAQPHSRLVPGADDALYGTTFAGGQSNRGTVFRLARDGSRPQTLHSFTGADGDGAGPYADLLVGPDALLYGGTFAGGTNGEGTLFSLAQDGSDYRVRHRFNSATGDGSRPYGRLIEGRDGAFYGTAARGGNNEQGGVFAFDRRTDNYRVVRLFAGGAEEGAVPFGGLVQRPDGVLLGATYYGGHADLGVLYLVHPDGTGFRVLHHLTGAGDDGSEPYASLLEASDGELYGTSWSGGSAYQGAVLRMPRDGRDVEVLHSFAPRDGDGGNLYGGLIEGSDGALYGTTVFGGDSGNGTVFRLQKNGSNYEILRHFSGLLSGSDAALPYGTLLEGSDGNLYGTTVAGGRDNFGTVFKLNKAGGNYNIRHHFAGGPADGAAPYAGLIEGGDGALYGTTSAGGSAGFGAVFRITKGGNYRLLTSLQGGASDGKIPYAGLCEGSEGGLYGVTHSGGAGDLGVVFRIDRDGRNYRVLHQFSDTATEGAHALTGLFEAWGGLLYGTTTRGGAADRGTVFRLAKDGSQFSVLHGFANRPGAGIGPGGPLARGTDGALYGTTTAGGIGCGTLYRLYPAATFLIGAAQDLRLAGPSGFRFAVQTRAGMGGTDAWRDLTNVTLTATPATVLDPDAGSTTETFYRAVWLP